jgi:hypothetical protein
MLSLRMTIDKLKQLMCPHDGGTLLMVLMFIC